MVTRLEGAFRLEADLVHVLDYYYLAPDDKELTDDERISRRRPLKIYSSDGTSPLDSTRKTKIVDGALYGQPRMTLTEFFHWRCVLDTLTLQDTLFALPTLFHPITFLLRWERDSTDLLQEQQVLPDHTKFGDFSIRVNLQSVLTLKL
jgi:hypothetical protein